MDHTQDNQIQEESSLSLSLSSCRERERKKERGTHKIYASNKQRETEGQNTRWTQLTARVNDVEQVESSYSRFVLKMHDSHENFGLLHICNLDQCSIGFFGRIGRWPVYYRVTATLHIENNDRFWEGKGMKMKTKWGDPDVRFHRVMSAQDYGFPSLVHHEYIDSKAFFGSKKKWNMDKTVWVPLKLNTSSWFFVRKCKS